MVVIVVVVVFVVVVDVVRVVAVVVVEGVVFVGDSALVGPFHANGSMTN